MAVLKSGTTIGGVDVVAQLNNKLDKSGGTITGNLTLKGSGNYGNRLNFGDGDYVHLYEISDDKLEIKASNINFVVSGDIQVNGASAGLKPNYAATDYTTYRPRSIALMTSTPSSISNGCIAMIYS